MKNILEERVSIKFTCRDCFCRFESDEYDVCVKDGEHGGEEHFLRDRCPKCDKRCQEGY